MRVYPFDIYAYFVFAVIYYVFIDIFYFIELIFHRKDFPIHERVSTDLNTEAAKNMNKLLLSPPSLEEISKKGQFKIPPSMGRGNIINLPLNSGMRLVVSDYTFHKPTALEYINPCAFFGFGFCLSGEIETCSSCLKDSFFIKAGQSVCFSFPDSAGFTEIVGPERLIRISVLMNPDFLPTLARKDSSRLPAALIKANKAPSRFTEAITPCMRTTIDQILRCPYHGLTRRLFIESKVMELAAYKMAQLEDGNQSTPNKAILTNKDIERVRDAARLLTSDLENTPNMAELARSVGVCRSKLYYCFRAVYGITPLDYLRNKRLETAEKLLNEGKANVTEASYAVGYASLSHFSRTFKKHFGFPPGKHLKNSIPPIK